MVRPMSGEHRTAGGWPQGWRVPAGLHVYRRVLPPSLPVHVFTSQMEVPIGPYGFAQGTIAAGTLSLSVGPAGAGTTWELAQASISTTTGANDASTCAFYVQPAGSAGLQAFQAGQSYAGGGDQVGLSGIKMVTGERLYAVWSSAHNGDTATLILTGLMTVLA